jgi:hypothetical protein
MGISRKTKRPVGFAVHRHLIGALGAFGGNYHPLFGHEILAEFGHECTSNGIVCAKMAGAAKESAPTTL